MCESELNNKLWQKIEEDLMVRVGLKNLNNQSIATMVYGFSKVGAGS